MEGYEEYSLINDKSESVSFVYSLLIRNELQDTIEYVTEKFEDHPIAKYDEKILITLEYVDGSTDKAPPS